MIPLASLTKYAPFAAILGYAAVYQSKGWNMVMADLTTISIDRLQNHWQNIAIAIGALIAINMLRMFHIPSQLRPIVVIALYFIAGYNVALTIDPPYGNGRGTTFVPPASYNPYSLTGV